MNAPPNGSGTPPAELIERKRDGEQLAADELRDFLFRYLEGEVADYQMSAFLMAVYFQGLSAAELEALTDAIVASGERLDFRDGGAPAVDKHSTGGVGDKVSLVLAPLVAEAGLRVPMMAGRGLGHTGGTLDKLEAIPGFRTELDLDEFRAVLKDVGCAIIGQTARVAPLDGRLYALRDVTGTVPSIPLIASSIVSKKAVEGIEALVLDVKCGSGALVREEDAALELARIMVGLAEARGIRTAALVTDMDSPLGVAVGNALETAEAVRCLQGEGPSDLRDLTLALAGELLVAGGRAASPSEARERLAALLDSGRAAARFGRMVERQGGDPRLLEDPDVLPRAPVRLPFRAPRAGRVASVDARRIGRAAVELGAGRTRLGDTVDPAVGFEIRTAPGDRVDTGDELARIHARSDDAAARAAARLERAIRLEAEGGEVARPGALLRHRVTAEDAAPRDGAAPTG